MNATTSPEEAVRAGNLTHALKSLQDRVRATPANAKDRIFLFQLLALLGQWDRALTQLKVAADLDASTLILHQLYRQAILAEKLRARVFSGTTPLVVGEPPEWMGPFLEALRLQAGGHRQQAADLRAQALELAPTSAGTINGERFEWIADGDTRIGPCLEVIVDGKYMWAPFERIQSLTVEPPTDLRDLVWSQAIVTWVNGGQTPALIPARYPATENIEDDSLRMGRRTEWNEDFADTYSGLGQRMLTTDAGEYPMLEVRQVVFDARSEAG
jgi:type VI secretion system protein ImpE